MRKIKVNEIFYSLQGEGHYTGTPAVFLRLSGCNMRCSFCDTRHETFNEMTLDEITREVTKYPTRHIVITGGEPTLQLSSELTTALHQEGFFIQIETNGSLQLEKGIDIDWITCSPKGNNILIQRIDELKLLFIDSFIQKYSNVIAKEYRLQPLDTGNQASNEQNLRSTIHYILKNPKWKLSLQTHKIINVQ